MGATSGTRELVLTLVLTLALVAAHPLAAVAAPEPSAAPGSWVRPVPGPVVEPFQAPRSRYGPGHRGADLAAPAGAPVRAAGAGEVTFAGPVAGQLHVTVAHPGGLRTSYSFLSRVDVRAGQQVERGGVVGVAGGGEAEHRGTLHLGLRMGERYLDPMLLFAPLDLAAVVHLAPTVGPGDGPDESAATEASELAWFVVGGGGASRAAGDVLGTVSGWVGAAAGAAGAAADDVAGGARVGAGLLEAGATTGVRLARDLGARTLAVADAAARRSPVGALVEDLVTVGRRLVDWARSRRECTVDPAPTLGPAGSGHLAFAVGGVNSQTAPDGSTFGLRTDALGYRPGEVTWFSYARGRGDYSAADTWGDLRGAAIALGDQLRRASREAPGREFDLIAHSQGGLVVDEFLQHVYDAADPAYPPIGTVVTLSSPHEGAPLASAATATRTTDGGRLALDVANRIAPDALPPPGAPVVGQLAEDSAFLHALWDDPLPEHVELTTIGAVDDVVVPATAVSVPGATEVVVDPGGLNDHSAVVSDPAALGAARLALEGRAPPCIGIVDGVRGAVEPVVIHRAEATAGAVARRAGQAIDLAAEALP